MNFLKAALDLADLGFHVFPLIPNSKLPAIMDFPHLASRDTNQIKRWWVDPVLEIEKSFNIGVSTTRFAENRSIVCVDVDNKNGKNGSDELLGLELEGCEFPDTFTQITPTGGQHLVYWWDQPIKGSISKLGKGLDILSKGKQFVGAGSTIDGKSYKQITKPITRAPDWLIEWCGKPQAKSDAVATPLALINQESAVNRAIHYLKNEAPASIQNAGGDHTAYKVAARVKDCGVAADTCLHLMMMFWNDRCQPEWAPDELKQKIEHAYKYGNEPLGSSAPETSFDPIDGVPEKLHPIEELNKEYAFVIAGGGSHILWQTVGPKGEYRLEHLGIQSFHQKLASQLITLSDGRTKPISQMWMTAKERRSYDGICFMPGLQSPPRFYNLWKGFTVKPADAGPQILSEKAHKSLEMFLSHAKENVCHNDLFLFKWLMGYFAHLIQKPWEKPLVALVLRGKKGVGKNALVDRIGHLLGVHYLLTSNRRYLIGNFNGFLENLLFFALDEAFWSGDKQAEGMLKDLITGKTHVIEHKGKEPYAVDNCTRICILGNEGWLVPASQDERRFAVYDVGDGKKQNRSYFQTMREGMEAGGYSLLLRYLLDFDLIGVDINAAPSTRGLMDQKISSLDPFLKWWLECLTEGRIVDSDFGDDWTQEIERDRFRQAFVRYVRERHINKKLPEDRIMGRMLADCLPSLNSARRQEGNERVRTYKFPSLEQARKEWETYIGHEGNWE